MCYIILYLNVGKLLVKLVMYMSYKSDTNSIKKVFLIIQQIKSYKTYICDSSLHVSINIC